MTPTGRIVHKGKARNLGCIHRDYARALGVVHELRSVLLANGARLEDPFAPPNGSPPVARRARQASPRPVDVPALRAWSFDSIPEVAPLYGALRAFDLAGVLWSPARDAAREAYAKAAYGVTSRAGIERVTALRFQRFVKVSRTVGAPE